MQKKSLEEKPKTEKILENIKNNEKSKKYKILQEIGFNSEYVCM